jgi:Fe-S cluster biogenesis protein NfuA
VSMMTLKNGVEIAVKNAVPKVKEVIEISTIK